MKCCQIVVPLSVVLLAMFGGRPASAQNPLMRMGGLVLSAFAGGGAFSDLQRSAVRAEQFQPPTNPINFTRRLSPETSPALAVAAGYWFNPTWGLRLQAGLAPTRFGVKVAEREAALIPADTALVPRAPFARLNVWTFDAAVVVRAPFTPRGRVAPYGLLGGGVQRYMPGGRDPLPPEVVADFVDRSTQTRGALVFGVGAIVPLQRRNLALTFEFTDHLSRTPVEGTVSGTVAEGETIRIVSNEPNDPTGGRVSSTHFVRLLIGVSWLMR